MRGGTVFGPTWPLVVQARGVHPAVPSTRAWTVQALLSTIPVLGWGTFHLVEQWPAFGGPAALVRRLALTSHGWLAIALESLLVVLPVLGWLVLEVGLRWREPEPPALRGAMAEDPEVARRLGWLARAGAALTLAFLLYHAAWLWLPKLPSGGDPVLTWVRLETGLGLWVHAVPHAIGITAFAVHVWAAPVRLLVASGWADTAETRRALRLSTGIIALGFFALYAQLAGWLAAGVSTMWPL
ncbi:MAG: hypothetical protein ACFCGT_14005 [Sandaracinaceae bacterium]